ncbi:MAG: hypothetical protein HYV67_01880 [Candidatus Taylorbacteria bacterium]|nr:hypothetical protein [Candidatus Taylorbacteria bacterium]
MITLVLLTTLVLLLFGVAPLAVSFLYYAAKKKQQASFVREATMEFVMAGGRCIRILENIKGWYYDRREFVEKKDPATGVVTHTPLTYTTKVGKLATADIRNLDGTLKTAANTWYLDNVQVPVKEAVLLGNPTHKPSTWWKKVRQYLRHRWGFFWVSAFYPQTHIHKFQVVKSRLRRNVEHGQTPIEEMIEVDATPAEVDNLLWRFPRAVLIGDIEFADRLTASLVAMSNFQVVMPNIPVFIYKADFFPQIESLVRSTVIDYCRKVKLADFITSSPIGPVLSFFTQIISQVNPEMISQYGVEIQSSWIVEIELGDSEEQKALKAKELAELQGQAGVTAAELAAKAVVATAEGAAKATVIGAEAAAKATTLKGTAEAEVLKTKVEKAGEAVVIADLHRQRVTGFTGSVLSEGGASGTGVMVSVPAKPERPAPTATPPTP